VPSNTCTSAETLFTGLDVSSDGRFYAAAEYLLWWITHNPLPQSLITTGPVSDNPGALGHDGTPLTRPSQDQGGLSGVRVSLGWWLDRQEGLGVEIGGFVLPGQTKTVSYRSDASGNPVLAFRYLDPPVNGVAAEDAFQAALPSVLSAGPPQIGPYAGSVGFTSRSQLWGLEANVLAGSCKCEEGRLQLLAGFRYLDLSENLDLSFQRQAIAGSGANVVFQGTSFPDPSAVLSMDSFHTRNQFYAGQVGLRGELSFGVVFLAIAGKVALGDLHESVAILGTSTLVPGTGPSVTVPGGQFAAASNSGHATRDEFAVLPEFEIAIGCQISRNLRAYIGYDLLYLNKVARPGSQVDLIVDTKGDQIDPGFTGESTTFPRALFRDTNFWAQGLNAGLEFTY
jgi:hypothetical protein